MNDKEQPTEVFYKKAVFKKSSILTGKQLCWSLFLVKLQAIRSVTLLKEILTQVFVCEYCKIFMTALWYPRFDI